MDAEVNPFHELYVTEAAKPEEFVQLFSPFLVEHALLLFQHGNVVVKGTQGSGKSMLLNLLKPEIRWAYHKTGTPFSVPERLSSFVGAGIHLRKSGIMDIGQLPLGTNPSEDEQMFPLYFADFLNYWIVRDVIRSVRYMAQQSHFFKEVRDFTRANLFARMLSKERCWFGYLDGVTDLAGLYSTIDGRLAAYKRFHQANPARLPELIKSTKTSIAEPIFRVASCLRKSGVIHEEIPIFVRIDEIEQLYRSDDLRPTLGVQYRRVINKALSMREAKISFRLGTRRYAWSDDITIYGGKTAMEIERDYRVIDIDDILRRKENVKWIFPDFAEDIFRRRLAFAKLPMDPNTKHTLRTIMRATPKAPMAAAEYAGNSEARRALKFEKFWPKHWIIFLTNLFNEDPLSAKLAEAWLRQGKHAEIALKLRKRPPKKGSYPWERTYWKKERVRQALMQLAARCAQRLMWSGEENIIALSTGSTLMFVSLCQHIWDAFLRSERGKPRKERTDLLVSGIDRRVQAVAIQTASTYWYNKIAEQPGGSDRKRFIDRVGRVLYESLINDQIGRASCRERV